jgi:aconitate hydratase
MSRPPSNAFQSRTALTTPHGPVEYWRLEALEQIGLCRLDSLPYSVRVLLENVLRNVDGFAVTEEHVRALAGWRPAGQGEHEIPFTPARVILQDFTGVPCVVDLAAMRSAMQRMGGDPARINPQCPVDLVIDHSVQVDHYAQSDALDLNAKLEFHRNRERYEFLRWGQKALRNFRVVPPATGIVHQVNLEHLAKVVLRRDADGAALALPDTLVGTDSHTTMINGLGVLGWGVGGIEAEAAMLGQPMYMLIPDVVGFRLSGRLREGATATDLVLRVTELLRKLGVVDKFVEFFGEGLASMSVADRATIANMAPEYGATMGFFPVDERTLDYLRLTGRSADEVALVEAYCRAQGLFRTDASPDPQYTTTIELDLSTVEPALAGPKRPQDRVNLTEMKPQWHKSLASFGKQPADAGVPVRQSGGRYTLQHGNVVIAAITSCTNTSNPSVMVAAGLLAKKAAERGLQVKPWVKTSLAPGSRVVTDYLDKAGLTPALERLGFHTVGYGCTTCIGNSGPLPEHIRDAVLKGDLVVASVLSGNRNFEARINPNIKANYLASPPLVVAYALAGTVDHDLAHEPLGADSAGRPVFLRDIWPTQQEIEQTVSRCVDGEVFRRRYADVFTGPPEWQKLPVGEGLVYDWNDESTYIQEPPYFIGLPPEPPAIQPIRGARVLALLGDSVTTDHISPAGEIDVKSPAGRYLTELGVDPVDFNSYGSRRGNDRVMTRGTFANPRLRNQLAAGTEGGWTLHHPTGQRLSIFDAAMKYKETKTPLIVLAGKDYGMGSSRDWAAKGTLLLGVRAAIAVSFERIHRSNLVGMGVLPLQFLPGQSAESLGLKGAGIYDIPELGANLRPGQTLTVQVHKPDQNRKFEFQVRCRLDTPVDIEYYRHGGVLPLVLRKLMRG